MIHVSLSSAQAAMANHLWQSTVVALLVFLLTLALRSNRARARFWLWLIASVKFLLPFSILIAIGGQWAKPASTEEPPGGLYSLVSRMARPVPQPVGDRAVAENTANEKRSQDWLPFVLIAIWLSGSLAISGRWYIRWRRFAQIAKHATPVQSGHAWEILQHRHPARKPLVILSSPNLMEPAIFGVFRPVLLWPAEISSHLQTAELETILAHELEHVRCCDNLFSAMHMLVETLFWFHPLVWWVGKHLVDEREQACDESVLESCMQPQIYAESLLKVCRFCLQSRVPCVTGVTGSDLKKRIVRIMTSGSPAQLSKGRKLLLTAGATILPVGPLLFGLMQQPQNQIGPIFASSEPNLPAFEVASVKPDKSGTLMMMLRTTPSGFIAQNIVLRELVRQAYRVEDNQIIGAPSWVDSTRYDLEAKVGSSDIDRLGQLTSEERGLIMQPVLADRFHLKAHTENRDLTVLVLVVSKGGAKLHEAKPGDTYPNGIKGFDGKSGGAGLMHMGPGEFIGQGLAMPAFAHLLSQQLGGHIVLDETRLTGKYDVTLRWTPDRDAPPPMGGPGNGAAAADTDAPSLPTALQEQLGLKLESRKATVPVLVIDHIEPPSEN
jgi:bla regulator protein blaR1